MRTGYAFSATTLCTVKLSRALFPQEKKHNLDSLIARFDLQGQDRHRALADADLIHQLWIKLRAQLPEEKLREALVDLCGHPSLPSSLDPTVAEELPESCGSICFGARTAHRSTLGNLKTFASGSSPTLQPMSIRPRSWD